MSDHESLDGMTVEGRLDYWRQRALKAEIALEDMKDISRCKARLIADLGYTEASAHRYLQTTAMDQRRTMGSLARDILKGLGLPPARETAANNG